MYVDVESDLMTKFPGLRARYVVLKGVKVGRESPELEGFKSEVAERVKQLWTLDQLREHPVFRAYRDFFWRIGVDPTKNRPASEALIRRVLRGRALPVINTLVDSYNLASMDSAIPLAAFDEYELAGELMMREANPGEKVLGIGMEKPVTLGGGEVVVEDGEKLVAVYPYRDADVSKITFATNNLLLMVCGVSNIDDAMLEKATRLGVDYVTRFCGGTRL